ncbi:efflux RND transporter periplasmic adaptor subunit [Aquirhabdus sp.]|uniref:efflux RND transporter periplasmic adaptor subunit n=1 Tax=Aquirhabdus sp. TaxID=2824160 RepID=UPI00396CDCA9
MSDIDINKLRVDRQQTSSPIVTKKRRIKVWHILVLLVVAALAYFHFFPSAVLVQTTQVVSAWPSQQYVLLDSTGYVVARRKAAVASKGTGRVEWLGVSEGQHVKQGTVIARLENHDVASAYKAAVANSDGAAAGVLSAQTVLSDANDNLHRVSFLYNKGLVAQITMHEALSRVTRAKQSVAGAQATLAAARANQDNAQSALDYTEIRAPFDGVVIARSANVGDIVTPLSSAADAKGAVAVMADMSTLEVNADVSESSLGSISVGQPCEIALDAFPDRRFRGEVSAVVPAVNRASATVTTKVRIIDIDSKILPDMSARVSFLSKQVPADQNKPVLAVSPQAIVKRHDHDVVYTLSAKNTAQEIPVTVGAQLSGVRAIQGNLKVGEVLVLEPAKKIVDGTLLKLPETH